MKLDLLNEAQIALTTLAPLPFETRLRHGLINAETVVRCVRAAAFTAQQAKVAGTLDADMREAILEQIWDELVGPA